jgi:hypothetical protein
VFLGVEFLANHDAGVRRVILNLELICRFAPVGFYCFRVSIDARIGVRTLNADRRVTPEMPGRTAIRMTARRDVRDAIRPSNSDAA